MTKVFKMSTLFSELKLCEMRLSNSETKPLNDDKCLTFATVTVCRSHVSHSLTVELLKLFAGSSKRGLQTISLGQGQGPIAEKMVMEVSGWLLLFCTAAVMNVHVTSQRYVKT